MPVSDCRSLASSTIVCGRRDASLFSAAATTASNAMPSLGTTVDRRPAGRVAEESYVGTALTMQTAIGFLLTTVTIQLVPVWETAVGWRWAMAPLALGPALGTLAMLRLRSLPVARKLAGGRR